MTESNTPLTGKGAGTDAKPRLLRPFFPDTDTVRTALVNGNIGVWSWDIASDRVTWSINLEGIYQLAEGSFDGTFTCFENDIHPDDRASVVASIKESVRTHKPHRAQYRLPSRAETEELWIESLATVELKDGAAVRMIGTCRDVTDRVRLHRELRTRASQQEAVARLSEKALIESDLQKFLDEAVPAIAENAGVEMVKILELVPGDAALLLRAGVGWKPGVVGTALVSTGREAQAGFTLASGGPVVVDDLRTEKRFPGQPILHDHDVISGVTTPIAGRDGRAYGVLGVHTATRRKFNEYDVSFIVAVANVIAGAIQRRQLDQRHEMMIRELRHRSGNLFSQLLAMFSQTAKTSKNVPELVTKYEARVLALANAHRLITEGGWKSASLTEILNTLLAPYLDRITFAGPDVYLEPDTAFGVSMAVHELATNAGKFGSLSMRPGHVEVTWEVKRSERGPTLEFDWTELEGPSPKRSRRSGFGVRLITMVIERQLNGEVKLEFAPSGVTARLIVPLTHERWPVTRPAVDTVLPEG